MRKKKLNFRINKNGCFIVTSHCQNSDGYCNMWHNKKFRRMHRHVYEECFGEIAVGLVVRHKCDVRNCINPEHMELGTPKENSGDSVSRGRNAKGNTSGTSKITEQKARQIKIMLKDGKKSKEITEVLKVSEHIVRAIRKLRTWKHVDISA